MTSTVGKEFNAATADDKLSPLSRRLVEAVLSRETGAIAAALRQGASPDAQVPDYGPLLTFAVRQGNDGLVRELAEAGATIDQRDAGGDTALIWAAHYGLCDVVEYLLERGADPALRGGEGLTACQKAKQTADDMDPDDPARTVEDIQNSFQRLGRAQLLLLEAETEAVKKKAPEIFHEGLSSHMAVRAPLKLKARVR